MITLNSEQGLSSIESWNDIESRPGFCNNLNPSDHQLDSIIGRYMFKDKIKCGLSNCHTPHARGYIVNTKEGLSTNIGKDCGKKYFGVDFETQSRKFDRDITAAENRSRLGSFSFQIEELERALTNMRYKSRGADWIHKKTSALVSIGNGCPEGIVRRISSMVRNGSNILTMQREATEAEIETLEAMHGRKIQRPHVVEETVAEIVGLQALYPENNLRSLLILDLETNLNHFKELDIDSLNFDELSYWTKWIGTVENTMERAATALTFGDILLSRLNLEPFIQVLPSREDIALFRTYLRELSE